MSSLFDDLSRRDLGRLSVPLIVTAVDGWPALLVAREIEGSDSGSAAPVPKEGKPIARGESGERHGRAENSSSRSLVEIHYPYNAIETEPTDRREQALGKSPNEKKSERSVGDLALGKADGRPQMGIMLSPDKSVAKNIGDVEKGETAADLFKIAADIVALVRAEDKDAAAGKLQKDTVDFIFKGLLEAGVAALGEVAIERMPSKFGPIVEYGSKKGAGALFAPEIEMINDGVTALRHAVTRGDFTEMREISDHARRVTFDLAFHLYVEHSFLHPRSPGR